MLDNIKVFCQSAIKINDKKVIYFDPYLINDDFHDADIIFITHEHYDHFDLESINKIIKKDTIIIVPNSMINKVSILFENYEILGVDADKNYKVYDINFKTIRAYNINTKYHPKENNWLGYLIQLNNEYYYVMGDTDDTPDARNVKCDYLFVPIGGTYTMNSIEARELVNYIKPKVVIPIHYKTIVGTDEDFNTFINGLDNDIKYKKYI